MMATTTAEYNPRPSRLREPVGNTDAASEFMFADGGVTGQPVSANHTLLHLPSGVPSSTVLASASATKLLELFPPETYCLPGAKA